MTQPQGNTVWGLETFDSNTLELIHVLVFLDVDEIAEAILEQAITSSAKYPAPGEEFVDARKALSRNSIIRRNKQTKSLSWHRLIRDVAMSKMPQEQVRPYFELAVELLHCAWRFAADRFSREEFKKEECDKVLPHVNSVLEHYKRVSPVDPLPTRSVRQLVKLLQEAGWYLVQGAQHETACPMFELAMQICESHGAEMMDLLADTCFSFASLAQGYLLLNQFQQAIDHCQQCINLEAALPDVQSGDAMPQFAFIYQAWGWLGLGDYEKPRTLPHRLGLALHCLGNAQAGQNKRAESLQSYMKALTSFRQTLGPNDFRVGQINLKIAEHFAAVGSAQPAGLYFSQAIEIFQRIPYYKPELARAYFKHHIFIQSRKNPESSSSCEDASYSKAVELYKQLKPEDAIPRRFEERHFDALVRFWSR
ncbi:hypothetical protein LCI18_003137 [Fusarium solani-melongenae]|uniref:Uncharacterized protein n=1 Tax=Fusarium solani subsp. cucurbitae TaxID=2747967 RepID=A0ACD3YTA0_FUSSC|nr:hypothetical protein LCI18_003137 [Fusarium solani-melongenae]